MPVASCVVDDATLKQLDDIATEWRVESGQNVSRSDVLKQAIKEFLRNQN